MADIEAEVLASSPPNELISPGWLWAVGGRLGMVGDDQ